MRSSGRPNCQNVEEEMGSLASLDCCKWCPKGQVGEYWKKSGGWLCHTQGWSDWTRSVDVIPRIDLLAWIKNKDGEMREMPLGRP